LIGQAKPLERPLVVQLAGRQPHRPPFWPMAVVPANHPNAGSRLNAAARAGHRPASASGLRLLNVSGQVVVEQDRLAVVVAAAVADSQAHRFPPAAAAVG
jgi:hypothetical protein